MKNSLHSGKIWPTLRQVMKVNITTSVTVTMHPHMWYNEKGTPPLWYSFQISTTQSIHEKNVKKKKNQFLIYRLIWYIAKFLTLFIHDSSFCVNPTHFKLLSSQSLCDAWLMILKNFRVRKTKTDWATVTKQRRLKRYEGKNVLWYPRFHAGAERNY